MNSKTLGTIRSTIPEAWITLVVWLVGKFSLDLDDADWSIVVLILPIASGIFYRIAREVETRVPFLGKILFGSGKIPTYDEGSPS